MEGGNGHDWFRYLSISLDKWSGHYSASSSDVALALESSS